MSFNSDQSGSNAHVGLDILNFAEVFKGKCDEHLAGVEEMPGAYVPTCEEDGHYT